jgi:hypothetical protein
MTVNEDKTHLIKPLAILSLITIHLSPSIQEQSHIPEFCHLSIFHYLTLQVLLWITPKPPEMPWPALLASATFLKPTPGRFLQIVSFINVFCLQHLINAGHKTSLWHIRISISSQVF